MKTRLYYFIALILTFGSCKKDNEKPIKEIPDEIIRTETCATLYSRIGDLFPEAVKIATSHPYLLSDTVQKKIILTEESEVYISFIAEKATYKNTVGWYSYTTSSQPKTLAEINVHLLFPNVSGKGEGGELVQGDMLQLGDKKFPKGTVIGFFLIVQGWQNGSINYNGITHFTDYFINQGGFQQHILFKEKNCGDIVIGFEDLPISQLSDLDFNDILFTISDNKEGYQTISFDIDKLPNL